MQQPRERPRLEAEPVSRSLVSEHVLAQNLEGDQALEPWVRGSVHLADATPSQALHDPVTAQRREHQVRPVR
jgi:hypothetical protein